jgi:hypothetical protein
MTEATQPESKPPEVPEAEASSEPQGQQEATSDSPNGSGKTKSPRTPPTKQLATVRIAKPRQFDLLRAFAIAYQQSGEAVTLGEVSPHSGLTVNTISIITGFFVTSGLITRTDGNRFVPTEATIEFERSYHWNKETAVYALGASLESSWFGQVIVSRLKMRGSMTVQDATELLAQEAAASPEYKPQIQMTLDWLIETGVIEKDGNTLKIARKGQFKPPTPPQAKGAAEKHDEGRSVVSGGKVNEEGAITLNVAISIDVKELTAMSPDRISAFFQGLAAVVAAKGGIE